MINGYTEIIKAPILPNQPPDGATP